MENSNLAKSPAATPIAVPSESVLGKKEASLGPLTAECGLSEKWRKEVTAREVLHRHYCSSGTPSIPRNFDCSKWVWRNRNLGESKREIFSIAPKQFFFFFFFLRNRNLEELKFRKISFPPKLIRNFFWSNRNDEKKLPFSFAPKIFFFFFFFFSFWRNWNLEELKFNKFSIASKFISFFLLKNL